MSYYIVLVTHRFVLFVVIFQCHHIFVMDLVVSLLDVAEV
jgi:hypothetical protein